jgi:RNA 2',3'-cyclic 3'-phosphodiesterase
MTESGRIRAFLAIPASPAWLDRVEKLTRRMKQTLPEASWTRPASWHLTLVFLGEIPRAAVERFVAGMPPLAEDCPSGTLESGEAVVFPVRGPARVLSVGFAASATGEALEQLSHKVHVLASSSLAPASLPGEKRFHPHVTLARIRRPWPGSSVDRFRREVEEAALPEWPVERCVLYESRLHPDGAVHSPVEEWPLGQSPHRARA